MPTVITKQQAKKCTNKLYYDRYSKSYVGCGVEGEQGEQGVQG